MSPEPHARHGLTPPPSSPWRRALRRLRRFFFEQEPGFLPTRHVDDATPPDEGRAG